MPPFSVGCWGQGIWDFSKVYTKYTLHKVYLTWDLYIGIPKVYLPELFELVSVGKLRRRLGSYRSASISVFSFVMTYNNKKNYVIFGFHVSSCIQNKNQWFFKFHIFRNIWIYPTWFLCFSNKGYWLLF